MAKAASSHFEPKIFVPSLNGLSLSATSRSMFRERLTIYGDNSRMVPQLSKG